MGPAGAGAAGEDGAIAVGEDGEDGAIAIAIGTATVGNAPSPGPGGGAVADRARRGLVDAGMVFDGPAGGAPVAAVTGAVSGGAVPASPATGSPGTAEIGGIASAGEPEIVDEGSTAPTAPVGSAAVRAIVAVTLGGSDAAVVDGAPTGLPYSSTYTTRWIVSVMIVVSV